MIPADASRAAGAQWRPAALLCALTLLASGCAGMIEVRPTGDVDLERPAETSVVLASDGSLLAELHAEQDRDVVPLDQIPEVLREAVLAIEDARFYSHTGVDLRAIARAFAENAAEGRVVQGGSTITQQLAKNTGVGDDQTLERKLREASVAFQIESRFTKDEILERYLNTVYFGAGAYGVQTASRRYFDVDVQDLTLTQAALLAGLVKAPSRYDPHTNPDAAVARRNVVLRVMAARGIIDPDTADAAIRTPVGVVDTRDTTDGPAPYFTAEVLKRLQEDPAFAVLGHDPVARADTIFRGGLTIETTLDPAWQADAERAVADTLTGARDPEAALVAIDPATGAVRALIGGRGWDDPENPTGRFNLATQARRQPGSTFKSLVLAVALAEGIGLDEEFPGGASITIPARPPTHTDVWEVSNYGNTEFRPLTLLQATAFSVNVVYAELIDRVGAEAVAALAEEAGVGRPLPALRSLALGAVEVTPLEMAAVQATFATGGLARPPAFVERIRDADGDVIWQRGDVSPKRVIDDGVAHELTTALEAVIDFGTGTRGDIQRPVAGKTGTTNDGTDAWFTGYTPDMAVAIWIGFPEGRVPMVPPRTRISVEGGTWPAEIFARFGLRALADVPANSFPVPASARVQVRVDAGRGCLPNPFTPPEEVIVRDFVAGTEPTEVCREPEAAPTVDVPDVRGLSREAAVSALQGAGFVVEVAEESSTTLPPGVAVRQDPPAGSGQTLERGYVATLWVSRAPSEGGQAVPDVLGAAVADAVAAIEEAGLVADVEVVCPGGGLDCTGAVELPGRVWELRPDAGAVLAPGAPVRLFVYPGG